LYATLKPRNETIKTMEYVFEGVEGIPFFSPTISATTENSSYIASPSDEAVTDSHFSINIADDKNSTSLEGTIYIYPPYNNCTYYFNPVYQSTDGSVYTTTGIFLANQQSNIEGQLFSHTLDASTTITENGKAKTVCTSIKLSISIMFAPEKINVLQMDPESKVLSHMEYMPDAVPETFDLNVDTAYLIVEAYKHDDAGKLKISRKIYGEDDKNIETFFPRADGICVKHLAQINWK